MTLSLSEVYGIDRLEVVSSPCLESLGLYEIYSVARGSEDHLSKQMGRVRIVAPKLQELGLGLSLEELEIDAPNLLSLSWILRYDDYSTNVKVVNLASNCRPSVLVIFPMVGFTPQWLRLSLSTTFAKFHHLNLVLISLSLPRQQVPLDLSQAEFLLPPPMINQVQYKPLWREICDIEEAAAHLDHLFWSCRPKFMSITKARHDKVHDLIAECMCREYLKIDSPIGFSVTSSWRHQLKGMKIENDTTGEMMEISQDVISSLANREKVRFMLTWC